MTSLHRSSAPPNLADAAGLSDAVRHFCYTPIDVPAKNPRVNVVLERPLYTTLTRLARRDGTSLSVKARDLLRDALESQEDVVLTRVAETRDKTFEQSRSLSHAEVWKAVKKRPRR